MLFDICSPEGHARVLTCTSCGRDEVPLDECCSEVCTSRSVATVRGGAIVGHRCVTSRFCGSQWTLSAGKTNEKTMQDLEARDMPVPWLLAWGNMASMLATHFAMNSTLA